MSMSAAQQPSNSGADNTVLTIILATSMGHFLNDMMQSLLPAIYPMLKENYSLSFWQIGLLTFTFQMTASILQPLVGIYTDRKPMPYSLSFGMGCTLVGLILLATAHHYSVLLMGAACVGFGSSVFHPEASRVARLASGGKHGFAQSLFQVGGNFGSSIGPLLAAFVVLPFGQISVSWFSVAALAGMLLLWYVGNWYNRYRLANARRAQPDRTLPLPRNRVIATVAVLALLIFTKYIYMASLTSYYTFYTIHHFGVSVQTSQILLFLFLGAVAAGTIFGGPIGDRIGTRKVIWVSILGVLPFTLALPYANLEMTAVLTVIIGFILASAFPAIVVFAQELLPGRVGMVSGLFFGFAFGMAGIAAAVLGIVADRKGIEFVYTICSYLPLLGLLTVFLPKLEKNRKAKA
ncbi:MULTISPECIES: MFS transporter [unclassified Ochrobactrum]|uniref:MFS transporter n=1 Tax=unclassified Ochrobactrum TaxID=239106 RepID=UPI0015F98BF3|nr:FSR family fosmidomycin resistance protein-like MFS transporter [Ochrobactrum sp. RH2CCR150]MDH7784985.1 FSR family fosmidomycin resistance protein-like MFS transporter [Ochrobactrum sp. 19YEA23]URQ76317.1 MAG: MFS transporter [Candidatus Ochrobactrum gambitense]WEK17071.1 MAG: MFS transporter [Candidatus Ochrobactrum gambitense]